MTKRLLTAASVIAIMGAAPAFADTNRTTNESPAQYNQEQIKEGWKDTKEAVSETAEDVTEAAKETYGDMKNAMSKDKTKDSAHASTIKVNPNMTAASMLGQPVYGANGESVALIEDIILDKDGNADLVILVDGEWTGLGKMAAFEYGGITQSSASGDTVRPLTEEMIDKAASFEYEQTNGFSVAKLLDAQLVNPNGETIAEIDNISFRDGEADQLIVGYDKTVGVGGKQAAMKFEDAELIRNDGEVDLKLSLAKTKQFEEYKKSSLN